MRGKKWVGTVSPRLEGSSPVRGKFFAQFFFSNTILADLTEWSIYRKTQIYMYTCVALLCIGCLVIQRSIVWNQWDYCLPRTDTSNKLITLLCALLCQNSLMDVTKSLKTESWNAVLHAKDIPRSNMCTKPHIKSAIGRNILTVHKTS